MSKQIGIDLGTSNTRIFIRGSGIVLAQPSVISVGSSGRRVIAVGDEAKAMFGKTPDGIDAYTPLQNGVIADFDVTVKMLHRFFSDANVGGIFSRPSAVVCIPFGVTEVERRAVEDATFEAGAKNVALIDEPLAAAIGSGLRINNPQGSMVVDIGGGTTEVSVISLGEVVISNSIRIAGNMLDRAISHYMKRKYQLLIGDTAAEALKIGIGSVHSSINRGEMEVQGFSLRTHLPATMTVTSEQMQEAMLEPVLRIVSLIKATLENIPPELGADIFDYGIMLSGGGALIGGLADLISERTGIRVTVAKRPLESVIIGIGRIIEGGYPNVISFRSR